MSFRPMWKTAEQHANNFQHGNLIFLCCPVLPAPALSRFSGFLFQEVSEGHDSNAIWEMQSSFPSHCRQASVRPLSSVGHSVSLSMEGAGRLDGRRILRPRSLFVSRRLHLLQYGTHLAISVSFGPGLPIQSACFSVHKCPHPRGSTQLYPCVHSNLLHSGL